MMTMANGRCDSEPMPWLTAAGIRPMAAIAAVMTTGRTRERTLSFTAHDNANRSFRLCLISEIIITPFWIQIPNNAMKPIPAEIEKLNPVAHNATIPPAAAKGTFNSTRPASRALENKMNRMTKMMAILTGTTCDKRFVARC